jgi:hypothetical protein
MQTKQRAPAATHPAAGELVYAAEPAGLVAPVSPWVGEDALRACLSVNTDAAIVRAFDQLPSAVRGWLLTRPKYETVSVHRLGELARGWREESRRYGLDSYLRGWLTERAQAFEQAILILEGSHERQRVDGGDDENAPL